MFLDVTALLVSLLNGSLIRVRCKSRQIQKRTSDDSQTTLQLCQCSCLPHQHQLPNPIPSPARHFNPIIPQMGIEISKQNQVALPRLNGKNSLPLHSVSPDLSVCLFLTDKTSSCLVLYLLALADISPHKPTVCVWCTVQQTLRHICDCQFFLSLPFVDFYFCLTNQNPSLLLSLHATASCQTIVWAWLLFLATFYVLRSAFVFPCPDVLYVLCDVIFASRTPDFESPHAICHTPHPILPRSIHRHRIQTPRRPVGEFCLGQIRSSNDMPSLTSLSASLTHLGCSCPLYYVLPILPLQTKCRQTLSVCQNLNALSLPQCPSHPSPADSYPHRSILIRKPPK